LSQGNSEQNFNDEKIMKNRSTGKQLNRTFSFEHLEGRRFFSVSAMGAAHSAPASQTPDVTALPKAPSPTPPPLPYPNIS
jgi:hypothetical protein